MRVLSWFFWFVLFVVALGFALMNQDLATLRFFGGSQFEWRAPLVIFLLIFFAAGTALGLVAVVPALYRQRREIGRLRKEVDRAAKAAASNGQGSPDAAATAAANVAAAARLGI